MSYYFREKPRFGERFRGKSGDELLQELKQQFGEDGSFFDTPTSTRTTRDPFERHTSFRGFPFDDEGFGRRVDIRSHLDDLAARHPEFADQLLGPPWADVPFPGGGGGDGDGSGGLLNRGNRNRRSSGSATLNHPDEDTRSQASSQGSGETDPEAGRKSQQIPQYGLRNTLDIGQHQHSMENPQQQRNVRSMSAPPENRNNQPENLSSQHPGHRFVSRVDITPQSQQQQSASPNQNQQREKSPAPAQKPQPQSQQQQGNVRHIPIFVEGRDEPVIARSVDEPDFPRRQQSPPQFHRPSHYQQHYEKHPSTEWTSHFQDPFFKRPTNRWGGRTQQTHQPEPPQQTNQRPKPQPQAQPHQRKQQQQQQQQSHQHPQQQYHQQQQQNEVQAEAPPKPKQIQPKDPLERVAMVQKEIDSLTEQVKQFAGGSRQDKQYMYLDEMLTRELIKLDDIETEGKENVRQARKQAIKSIQDSIGLLESKAPLPGQQPQQDQQIDRATELMDGASENKAAEAMETSEETAPEEQKAIPLPPPNPSSPTKIVPETQVQESLPQNIQDIENKTQSKEAEQDVPEPQTEAAIQDPISVPQESRKLEETQQSVEPMDSSITPQVPQVNNNEMEVRQSSPAKELLFEQEHQKENQDPIIIEQKQETNNLTDPISDAVPVTTTTEKTKKEPPPVPAKPNKSPKKAKKTKKQSEPVSETAIPLPAPGQLI